MTTTTTIPRMAMHATSRRQATLASNYAARYLHRAEHDYSAACLKGEVSERVRETYRRWERMTARLKQLRLWLDRNSEEAAAALKLAIEIGEIYKAPGDRAWRYLTTRHLPALNTWVTL